MMRLHTQHTHRYIHEAMVEKYTKSKISPSHAKWSCQALLRTQHARQCLVARSMSRGVHAHTKYEATPRRGKCLLLSGKSSSTTLCIWRLRLRCNAKTEQVHQTGRACWNKGNQTRAPPSPEKANEIIRRVFLRSNWCSCWS